MWEKIKLFFRRKFEKRDRRLVVILESKYSSTNKTTKEEITRGCLTYYLFEDQFGDRHFEATDSEEGDLDLNAIRRSEKDDVLLGYRIRQGHWVFRSPVYRERVKPWINGVYDPEIPDYYTIKNKEFKDALTGRRT